MTNLQGMTLPTCDILVNGQKRKLYGKNKNKVYLHNGDNFQLQVFNPLQERIGVQLCMNGKKVDNDLLVINPGQQILIERYIGTNNRLTFSAYEIDMSNMSESRIKEAKKAIEKNGELEVVFWNEKKQFVYSASASSTDLWYNTIIPQYTPTSGSTITFNSPGFDVTNTTINDIVINANVKINGTLDINNGQLVIKGASSTSGNSGTSGACGLSGTSGTSGNSGTSGIKGNTRGIDNSTLYSNTTTSFDMIDYAPQEMSRGIITTSSSITGVSGTGGNGRQFSKKIETGRIEKGGVSNQYFSPIYFEIGEPFYKIKFKLLPFSMKPMKKKLYDSTTIKNVIENKTYIKSESSVREYCKCGYRISRGKGSWDFCPRCGRKIKK